MPLYGPGGGGGGGGGDTFILSGSDLYWTSVSGSAVRNTGSAVLIPNGTEAAPGLAWAQEPGSGFRRQDGDIPLAVVIRGNDFIRFRGDGKMGINIDNPVYPLMIDGDFCIQNGGYNFRHEDDVESDLIFYRGGVRHSGSFQFRRIGHDWTILEVRAPISPNNGYEATISLTRDLNSADNPDTDLEFIDIYNNGYPLGTGSEEQYGIRMQKAGAGQWRPFVFDFWAGLGTPKIEVLRVDSGQRVGVGGVTAPSSSLHVSGSGITCWGDIAHMSGGLGFFSNSPVQQPDAYTVSNGLSVRSFDANNTSVEELADVLGTLIADLKAYGLLK